MVYKRYLHELSDIELKKVIEVNPKLKDELIDYYYEDEDYWVSEYMAYLKVDGVVLDYSISPHGRSYITFDKDKALTSLGNMHNYRGAFGGSGERFNGKLDRALEYLTFYEQSFDLFHDPHTPHYTHIKHIQEITYDTIWDYVKDLSELLVGDLLKGYNYDDDIIIEALHRKYIEDDYKGVYVKDDTYIVYKEVSYER